MDLFFRLWKANTNKIDWVNDGEGLLRRHPVEEHLLREAPRSTNANLVQYLKELSCSVLLCSAIYEEHADVHAKLNAYMQNYSVFDPMNAQLSYIGSEEKFVIVEFQEFVVVAIRGSWTSHDWYLNLQVENADIDVGDKLGSVLRVHSGFAQGFSCIPIRAIIRYVDFLGKRLVFTGHSKGGSIAEICARFASAYTPANPYSDDPSAIHRDVIAISFGSPHITASPETLPPCSVFRYVFWDDPVPFFLNTFNPPYVPTGDFIVLRDPPDLDTDSDEEIMQSTTEDITESQENSVAAAASLLDESDSSKGFHSSTVLEVGQHRVSLSTRITPVHSIARYVKAIHPPALSAKGFLKESTGSYKEKPLIFLRPDSAFRTVEMLPPGRIFVRPQDTFDESRTHCIMRSTSKLEIVARGTADKSFISPTRISLFADVGRVHQEDWQEIYAYKIMEEVCHEQRGDGSSVDCLQVRCYFDLEDKELNSPDLRIVFRDGISPPHTVAVKAQFRGVWFVGETGAGKSHLVRAIRTLLQYGPKSSQFKTLSQDDAGLFPSDTEESLHARGMIFQELLGLRHDDEVERRHAYEMLQRCPPRVIVFVVSAIGTKLHGAKGDSRGLPALVREFRMLKNKCSTHGSETVCFCFALTHWEFIKPKNREGKKKDLIEALDIQADEPVFGVNSCSPIEGVVELYEHICVKINDAQPLRPSAWQFFGATLDFLWQYLFGVFWNTKDTITH